MFIFIPISSFAVGKYGKRIPTLACAMSMLVSCGLGVAPQVYEWFIGHELSTIASFTTYAISMVFNGAAAAWLSFAGPVLAETWFGVRERTVVNAIVSVCPYVGVALGYILGPLCIPPGKEGKGPMFSCLWVFYLCAAFICIMIAWRFPEAPHEAPSLSAAMRSSQDGKREGANDRMDTLELFRGLTACGRQEEKMVKRSVVSLWVINLAFSLPLGVYSGWTALLNINLTQVGGLTQIENGVLGCCMSLFGCIGAVFLGRVNDRRPGQIKKWILLNLLVASICFIVFGAQVLGFLSPGGPMVRKITLFASGILGGFCINAPIPLFFELAVEQTFPLMSGSTSASVLSLLVTLIQGNAPCTWYTCFFVASILPYSTRPSFVSGHIFHTWLRIFKSMDELRYDVRHPIVWPSFAFHALGLSEASGRRPDNRLKAFQARFFRLLK